MRQYSVVLSIIISCKASREAVSTSYPHRKEFAELLAGLTSNYPLSLRTLLCSDNHHITLLIPIFKIKSSECILIIKLITTYVLHLNESVF